MNDKNFRSGQLQESTDILPSNQEIRELQEQMNDLQMEIDILKEMISV